MMKYKDPIFVFNRFEAFDSLREARELPDHEDLDNLINKVILDFYPKEANIHVSELKPIYNKDKYQFLHQQLVQSILHNKKAVRFTKETKVVDGKGIRKSKRLPSVVVVRRSKRKLVH
jgi:glycerol-3-phosphate responsive antiterminator